MTSRIEELEAKLSPTYVGVIRSDDMRELIALYKAEVAEAAAVLRQIASRGQSVEPDHWKWRCWARETAQTALAKHKPGEAV